MKRLYQNIFIILISAHVPMSAYAGNLVLNGDFETGDFYGWNTSDPSLGTFVTEAFDGYSAHGGNYFVAMGAIGQPGTISQILNTTGGATYTLNFFLASDGATPNEFKVVWGGKTIFDQINIPAQSYVEYTFQVTATDSTTNLTFYEENDNGFLSLDDVSVKDASIPEPMSLIPLGVGVSAVVCSGWYCRRAFSQTSSH